jgi:hypothetical protein
MVFSTKCDENITLLCGQRAIEKVDACRYLGVVIDDKLKWTSHIDQQYSKLVKFTSIFYKLRSALPEQVLKQIYFAFIHSRILYGIELYANTCNTYLDKLIKLNNKILRILQNRPPSVSVKDLYICITSITRFQFQNFMNSNCLYWYISSCFIQKCFRLFL